MRRLPPGTIYGDNERRRYSKGREKGIIDSLLEAPIIAVSTCLGIQNWDSLQRQRWGSGILKYARMGSATNKTGHHGYHPPHVICRSHEHVASLSRVGVAIWQRTWPHRISPVRAAGH